MLKNRFMLSAVCACLTVLLSSGCSRQKVPPPPKTQPELLLEIYDAARKQQFNAALLKIQKMRALDPTSVFLAELENTIRFNRMTAVVNTYINAGKFDAALHSIQEYEKKYGSTDESTQTREQLSLLVHLDKKIQEVKAARYSDQLEQKLTDLKKMVKNVKIPSGIANFIQKKESVIPELRDRERKIMLWELLQMVKDSQMAGDRRAAIAFVTVYAMESGEKDQILSLSDGPSAVKKP